MRIVSTSRSLVQATFGLLVSCAIPDMASAMSLVSDEFWRSGLLVQTTPSSHACLGIQITSGSGSGLFNNPTFGGTPLGLVCSTYRPSLGGGMFNIPPLASEACRQGRQARQAGQAGGQARQMRQTVQAGQAGRPSRQARPGQAGRSGRQTKQAGRPSRQAKQNAMGFLHLDWHGLLEQSFFVKKIGVQNPHENQP